MRSIALILNIGWDLKLKACQLRGGGLIDNVKAGLLLFSGELISLAAFFVIINFPQTRDEMNTN